MTKQSVTLEISGLQGQKQRESVREQLAEMTDGAGHSLRSSSSGDEMTITVSPVSDVDVFIEKIDFGVVTEVDGRQITVEMHP